LPRNRIADEFSELINRCHGRVTFITAEGDRLVANSMLSALVGFSAILSVAATMDIQIECENDDDCQRINDFMEKHQLGRFARN